MQPEVWHPTHNWGFFLLIFFPPSFFLFFLQIFANWYPFLNIFLPQKWLILQFLQNFCEIRPSSERFFYQNGTHVYGFCVKNPIYLNMWEPLSGVNGFSSSSSFYSFSVPYSSFPLFLLLLFLPLCFLFFLFLLCLFSLIIFLILFFLSPSSFSSLHPMILKLSFIFCFVLFLQNRIQFTKLPDNTANYEWILKYLNLSRYKIVWHRYMKRYDAKVDIYY